MAKNNERDSGRTDRSRSMRYKGNPKNLKTQRQNQISYLSLPLPNHYIYKLLQSPNNKTSSKVRFFRFNHSHTSTGGKIPGKRKRGKRRDGGSRSAMAAQLLDCYSRHQSRSPIIRGSLSQSGLPTTWCF